MSSTDRKELAILEKGVSDANEIQKQQKVNKPYIKEIFKILTNFISKKRLIIYGGTAINNLLPPTERFYNVQTDIPDYDVFSVHALEDGKYLADIYYKNGFNSVELKSALHQGTFKLFVNFIPVCDITQLTENIFMKLSKDAERIDTMLYAPINFLRMSMYEELSRPFGNVTRWEKVLTRLNLLNKYYPFLTPKSKPLCNNYKTSRKIVMSDKIFETVIDIFIEEQCVFFGGYAFSLFTKNKRCNIHINQPDFDVLHMNPSYIANLVQKKLKSFDFQIEIEKKPSVGELLDEHYLLKLGNKYIATIVKPMKCDSYNIIKHNNLTVRIATIDVILNYYLSFLYSNVDYVDTSRLLCMADYLFHLQSKNRTATSGLFKRFSISCYGKHATIEDIREEKLKIYNKYKNNKESPEYKLNFMKYIPGETMKSSHEKRKSYLNSRSKKKSRRSRNFPLLRTLKRLLS